MSDVDFELFSLESSVDDVQEAPDFITPPTGAYAFGAMKWELKNYEASGEREASKAIRILFYIVKTLELSDERDTPVPDGSMFSIGYKCDENGLGRLKAFLNKLFGEDQTRGKSWNDLLLGLMAATDKDADTCVHGKIVVTRKPKQDGDGFFENINFRDLVLDQKPAAD